MSHGSGKGLTDSSKSWWRPLVQLGGVGRAGRFAKRSASSCSVDEEGSPASSGKKSRGRERSFRWVPPPTFEIYKKNGKEKLD